MRGARPRAAFLAFAVAAGALAAACDRPPSADGLKEWSPADHDQEPGRPPANQGPRATGDGGSGAPAMVEVAWRNQCSSCHGASGHGDGPQGPMFKASDLTRPEWQASVKDEDIAATIKNGKGRMPKFDLPDEIVRGLVGRIRALGGGGGAPATASTQSPSSAPDASKAPR